MALAAALALAAVAVVAFSLRAPQGFDASAGPRGAVPAPPPGPPLPVLGVLGIATPQGGPAVYVGASIDWATDDPLHFNLDLGHAAAIQDAFFFLDADALLVAAVVNSSGVLHQVPDIFAWSAALVRGTGAIMGVSVIPLVPLARVRQSVLAQLAVKCRAINDLGVPVLLRFAPHMNGNWLPYGQDPAAFRNSFRSLAHLVKNTTVNTAMVWSPASGLGYPFPGGAYAPLNASDPRFAELDTDRDGRLTHNDDPFAPYYPGDDVVDWVGLSVFYTSPNVSLSFSPLPNDMPYPFPVDDPASAADVSIVAGDSSPSGGSPPVPSGTPLPVLSSQGARPRANATAGASSASASASASPSIAPSAALSSSQIVAQLLPGVGVSNTAGAPQSASAAQTPPWIPIYNNSFLPNVTFAQNSSSFEAQLTTAGTPFNFYRDYASARNKPLLVSEAGAAFYPQGSLSSPNVTELAIKHAWTRQIFNRDFLERYSLIRGIVMYNKQTPLRATSRWLGGTPITNPLHPNEVPVADFALTSNPAVLKAFQDDLVPLILAINGTNSTAVGSNGTATTTTASTTVVLTSLPQASPEPVPPSTVINANLTLTGFLIFANGTATVLNGTWTVVVGARGPANPSASASMASATYTMPSFETSSVAVPLPSP
ncbi:hypothetical protein HK105_208113 [Polyrhizophydium stewartii]|uniref:GH26 domain-containing protein n=1 Tax=Polyrhizophydium stewartii TaxID=2732419 RepID=A0ABR4MYQ4_9FUNG